MPGFKRFFSLLLLFNKIELLTYSNKLHVTTQPWGGNNNNNNNNDHYYYYYYYIFLVCLSLQST